MSAPGWYPDPSGDPGRIRYWDGKTWTGPSTARDAALGNHQQSRRRWSPAAVGGVAVAVAAAVLLAFLLWPGTGGPAAEDPRTARPTGSVWDEVEATNTPTPSTPAPPTETGGEAVECPRVGNERSSRHEDGRVTGGELAFPVPSGWRHPAGSISRVLTDQDSATRSYPASTWTSLMVLGVAPRSAGFDDARTTANQIIECHITSANFPGLEGSEIEVNEEFTVDGVEGWRVRAHASTMQAPGGGAVFEVVVVDTGHELGLSAFWGGVVDADADALTAMEEALGQLSVEG